MGYIDSEIINKDLDWFLCVNSLYIHAASAGGMLPNIIYRNYNENKLFAQKVKHMKYSLEDNEVEINPFLAQILKLDDRIEEIAFVLSSCGIPFTEDNMKETYIKDIYAYSFIKFARKGFYSFDRTNINNIEDNRYHLVARPMKSVHVLTTEMDNTFFCSNIEIKSHEKNGIWLPLDLIKIVDE